MGEQIDKIDKLEQRIQQLKARKQAMLRREHEKERKLRTRELIQTGAVFEKFFGTRNAEEAEKICQTIAKDSNFSHLKKLINFKQENDKVQTKFPT